VSLVELQRSVSQLEAITNKNASKVVIERITHPLLKSQLENIDGETDEIFLDLKALHTLITSTARLLDDVEGKDSGISLQEGLAELLAPVNEIQKHNKGQVFVTVLVFLLVLVI